MIAIECIFLTIVLSLIAGTAQTYSMGHWHSVENEEGSNWYSDCPECGYVAQASAILIILTWFYTLYRIYDKLKTNT